MIIIINNNVFTQLLKYVIQWAKYDRLNAFIPSKNCITKLYLKFNLLEKKTSLN